MIDGVEFLTVVDFTDEREPPNEDGLHCHVGFMAYNGKRVYLEVGRDPGRANDWYLKCTVYAAPFLSTDGVHFQKSKTYYTSTSRDAIAERANCLFLIYAGKMGNGR